LRAYHAQTIGDEKTKTKPKTKFILLGIATESIMEKIWKKIVLKILPIMLYVPGSWVGIHFC
jgi:hypothetical protein